MAEQIVISRSFGRVFVALINDGVVIEILTERADTATLVDNIYLGTVVRVMAGMQAAFVDIGRQKMAFLHGDDLPKSAKNQPIEHHIHQGQKLIVQVTKDETRYKGARLSTNIVLTSQDLVYRPYDDCDVRVSAKLPPNERKRLKNTLQTLAKNTNLTGSIIARTHAKDAEDIALKTQIDELTQRFFRINNNASAKKLNKAKNALLDEVLPLELRGIKALMSERTKRIIVDDVHLYDLIGEFIQPFYHVALELYQDKTHQILDNYGVQTALSEALARQVALPSGGSLVIERTEAMTTIDVNTGAYVGKYSDDETIYRTNTEAAMSIARQIRLRNLGGIIIIDFINMTNQAHQTAVMNTLKNAVKSDRAKVQMIGMNELGLAMLTRHRSEQSLAEQLCEPCVACAGSGYTQSNEMVAFKIIRELLAIKGAHQVLSVVANPSVINHINKHENHTLQDIERLLNTKIHLKTESNYQKTEYQIVFG